MMALLHGQIKRQTRNQIRNTKIQRFSSSRAQNRLLEWGKDLTMQKIPIAFAAENQEAVLSLRNFLNEGPVLKRLPFPYESGRLHFAAQA